MPERKMRIVGLKSALLRATSATLSLALFAAPAEAQLQAGPAGGGAAAAAPAAPAAPQRTVLHVQVNGTQRVEPTTVLTYVNIREGDPYDPALVDQALKALFATGLFSDVKITFDDATATLFVRVVENPIINQVVFEGNSKVSDKDLTKEIQIKPRSVFTRAKVQADVQRIIEVYRRNGKFAASVDPQIIQRPQNRVDLIFSITEGPTTGVARVNFIGNQVYNDSVLRGQIATEESAWWKFLASNDNYDPDRLAFDREQLRRYYVNHGYADFRVTSAVAQLTPKRDAFYITFNVSEGVKYTFGTVTIDSKIKELPPGQLLPQLNIHSGDVYDAEYLQKAIDKLTNAAGTKGYAFAEVHPRISRNRENRTIDVTFEIVQGPRVYIEKIDITGNSRTLDKVIRREFRLVEGDAFNRVLIDRSRTRIRSLGFFKDVDIKNTPGSQPDRTDLTVAVNEQSTGSISVGLGYSSQSQLVGDLSYTELNLFGRGQYLKASVEVSQIQKQIQFSYTEPWFLDRPLAAGFDLYKVITDYQQATFQSDTTAAVMRMAFPISEFSIVSLSYTYQIENVSPYANAPFEIQLAAGKSKGSIIGFTYGFNTLDDMRRPTTGVDFALSQSFAGFGGSLKFIKTETSSTGYVPMFADQLITSIGLRAGFIQGYDGTPVPINERFFEGGDTFRGFSVAGIGPRDIAAPTNTGAVGGNLYAIGTISARMPNLFPQSYGISSGLFTDFGTLGHLDSNPSKFCTVVSCIRDNLAFRASAGISLGWKSPFGPLQIDLGLPYVKTKYDRPQIIHFSTATGL